LQRLDANAIDMQALAIEYTRLFVGPGQLAAAPWELVYRTGKRELLQPGVVQIRALYEHEGCLPAERPNVSDDHLAIELDFMRFLCEQAKAAFEAGDAAGAEAEAAASLAAAPDAAAAAEAAKAAYAEAERVTAVQAAFIQEHLCTWLPDYTADLRAAARLPYYSCFATVLKAFVNYDAELLAELLAVSLAEPPAAPLVDP
jgi:TorA maturation chaperone TorD